MYRSDSEFVKQRMYKHIYGHILIKDLTKGIKALENPNKSLNVTYTQFWKNFILDNELSSNDVSEFLETLKLNRKKRIYSPKSEMKLYLHLLVRNSIQLMQI